MADKENIGWYSWFPGMGEETVPNTFKLVQYSVAMHRGLKEKKLETIETVVSLYLGEVICSGHFMEDDLIYNAILPKIYENEKLGVPLELLSEYSHDFDFLIILWRTAIGDTSCM